MSEATYSVDAHNDEDVAEISVTDSERGAIVSTFTISRQHAKADPEYVLRSLQESLNVLFQFLTQRAAEIEEEKEDQ